MGRRSKKLHTDALALFAGLALIDDSALLLFQRFGIRQHEHFAVVDFVLHQEQATMRADHHGFARLVEFFSIVRAALGLQPHFVKCAAAAPMRVYFGFAHIVMIS